MDRSSTFNEPRGTIGVASTGRIAAYFPTVGLPPHTYRFRGLQEGLDIRVDVETNGLVKTDPDRVLRSAQTADVTLIPEGRLLAKYFPYPVNALLGDVVQRLRKDPTMVESTPVELPRWQHAHFSMRRRA